MVFQVVMYGCVREMKNFDISVKSFNERRIKLKSGASVKIHPLGGGIIMFDFKSTEEKIRVEMAINYALR